MPTLNCIGKAAVVEHHKEVPFRLLNDQTQFAPRVDFFRMCFLENRSHKQKGQIE